MRNRIFSNRSHHLDELKYSNSSFMNQFDKKKILRPLSTNLIIAIRKVKPAVLQESENHKNVVKFSEFKFYKPMLTYKGEN